MHAIMMIHIIMVQVIVYSYTGAREGQRLERAVNTIIFFIAINKSYYYSYTDWYIIFTCNSADIQAWYLAKKLICT